jgi:threonine/homoserine/homoserine lactone efflux protein
LTYFSFNAFLYGLPTGFLFSFALGPVFFTLISCSLEYGFRFAIYIALGVILADIVLLGIAYSGIEVLIPPQLNVAFWVQLFGGVLLMGLGISNFYKKVRSTEGVVIERGKLIVQNLAKGFFLNILNPANFMEWFGTVGVLKHRFNFSMGESISFFAGALLGVFLTELGVAFFADRLKHFLTDAIMRRINIVSGIVFCAFGVWMLWDAAT